MKITKIIKGLKDGSILPREEALKKKAEEKEAAKAPTLLWSVADDDLDDLNARKGPMYIAAPKVFDDTSSFSLFIFDTIFFFLSFIFFFQNSLRLYM
jgi:hypothetical protein